MLRHIGHKSECHVMFRLSDVCVNINVCRSQYLSHSQCRFEVASFASVGENSSFAFVLVGARKRYGTNEKNNIGHQINNYNPKLMLLYSSIGLYLRCELLWMVNTVRRVSGSYVDNEIAKPYEIITRKKL